MSKTESEPVNHKVLQRMMYLYAAVMQGWQIRLLPLSDTGGKEKFEFMRDHLGDHLGNQRSQEDKTADKPIQSTPTCPAVHPQNV